MPVKIVNKVDDILRKKEDAETLRALKLALHPLGYRDITFEKKWESGVGMRIGLTMTWPGHQTPELLVLTMLLPDFEEWISTKCLTQPKVVGWLCNNENPSNSFGRVLKSNSVHYIRDGSIQNFSYSGPIEGPATGQVSPHHRKMDID